MKIYFRCNVPGCDQEPYQYSQSWLSNAIPNAKGLPEKCVQYEQLRIPEHPAECNSSTLIFSNSNNVKCNDFIYDTTELTLQNEVFFAIF